VRKRIYELFLEHRNQRTVARLLNEMGYRTRGGAKLTITTVGRWLRDPLAKGHRLPNVTVSLGMKKHRKLKSSSERAFGRVQPIVSEELWNQANTILNAKRTATQAGSGFRLFAGFTFCACGRQMSVISRSPTYFCKRCRNRISIGDLADAFHGHLRSLVSHSDEITRTSNPTDTIIKRKKERLQTLSRKRAGVSEEMDRVYQALIDDRISEEAFRRAYRSLETRLKQLDKQISRLLGELDRLRNQGLLGDEILAEAKNLHIGWQALGQDQKRRSIQNLVQRITVGRDNLRVDWTIA
jgi:site-specific DNA recombinase